MTAILIIYIVVTFINLVAPLANLGVLHYISFKEATLQEPDQPILFYLFMNSIMLIASMFPFVNLVVFYYIIRTFKDHRNEPSSTYNRPQK